jgi:hypothetical protein
VGHNAAQSDERLPVDIHWLEALCDNLESNSCNLEVMLSSCFYDLSSDAIRNVDYIASSRRVTMDWKGFRRKRLWPNRRTIPEFA